MEDPAATSIWLFGKGYKLTPIATLTEHRIAMSFEYCDVRRRRQSVRVAAVSL
jgi:hypothetical protein